MDTLQRRFPRFRYLAVPLSLLGLLLCGGSDLVAESDRSEKIIDGFLDTYRENETLSDEQRQQLERLVNSLRSDADFRPLTVTEALRELYPQFSAALELLGEEEVAPAVEKLKPLSEADEAFLAAESSFYLTRAYLMREQFESALPLLKRLTEDLAEKTLHADEALFLRGVSESRLLMRKEAIKSLETFLEQFPDAPERMRVGAWQHKELLKLTQDGSLGDVQDHMDFSRRRLALNDTGDRTQKVQDRIIEMLGKLIEEAEQKESQGQGSGEGEGEGEGQQNGQGNGQGGNVGGQGQSSVKALRRAHHSGQRTPWGDLRERIGNPETFAALKDKFPARYRQLIEQYYRSFEENPDDK